MNLDDKFDKLALVTLENYLASKEEQYNKIKPENIHVAQYKFWLAFQIALAKAQIKQLKGGE